MEQESESGRGMKKEREREREEEREKKGERKKETGRRKTLESHVARDLFAINQSSDRNWQIWSAVEEEEEENQLGTSRKEQLPRIAQLVPSNSETNFNPD